MSYICTLEGLSMGYLYMRLGGVNGVCLCYVRACAFVCIFNVVCVCLWMCACGVMSSLTIAPKISMFATHERTPSAEISAESA